MKLDRRGSGLFTWNYPPNTFQVLDFIGFGCWLAPMETALVAEVVEIPLAEIALEFPIAENLSPQPSWIWRFGLFGLRQIRHLFGMVSVVLLLAVAANIPILQFLSFGYLLEVMGRMARRQRISDAMVGLRKASVLGSIVMGTWLSLLPIRLISNRWYESYLIDPDSNSTRFLAIVQFGLMIMLILHVAAALLCGGKLRYFLWPLIAPFSLAVWCARRIANWKYIRRLLVLTTDWFAPGLAHDICHATPIVDWFLPLIFLRRVWQRNCYTQTRDQVWDFVVGLRLPYYFLFGLRGFIGSFLWLLLPTMLLAGATYTTGGLAISAGVLGVLVAIPIFAALPFLQAHYAVDGCWRRFWEIGAVFQNFGRAPLSHLFALLCTLVLALPLFFLKIEAIPTELLWTLSVAFLVFTWPAKTVTGWAYGRGQRSVQSSRWWLKYPIAMTTLPISFLFVGILTLTRYVSWNGALSLFENHVFLLPAPFWQ